MSLKMASIIRTISQRRIPTPKETTPRTNSTKAPDLPFHFCGDFVISRRAVKAKIKENNPNNAVKSSNKTIAPPEPAAIPEKRRMNVMIEATSKPREIKING